MFQFHDMGIGDGMSPRIHPKSMDTLLEQHQAEILEDLNSLGRYSRSVSHRERVREKEGSVATNRGRGHNTDFLLPMTLTSSCSRDN